MSSGANRQRTLRNDNFRAAFVHIFDDPIAFERLVRQHCVKPDIADQRRHANRIVSVGWHQVKPDEIAKRIDEREDFRGPAAFGLAYGLALRPPFAPIP